MSSDKVRALQRLAKNMRRLSYWAGIYAVEARTLAEGLEDDFDVLFPARPLRGAHPRLAVGTLLHSESPEGVELSGYRALAVLWAKMLAEASWQTTERRDRAMGFKVLSRREAWREGGRRVLAFGPYQGRETRLRGLKGLVHEAFEVLGFHSQPRDHLLAVEPLSWHPSGEWWHEFGAICAIGGASVVLTPEVAAWIFTGEDD